MSREHGGVPPEGFGFQGGQDLPRRDPGEEVHGVQPKPSSAGEENQPVVGGNSPVGTPIQARETAGTPGAEDTVPGTVRAGAEGAVPVPPRPRRRPIREPAKNEGLAAGQDGAGGQESDQAGLTPGAPEALTAEDLAAATEQTVLLDTELGGIPASEDVEAAEPAPREDDALGGDQPVDRQGEEQHAAKQADTEADQDAADLAEDPDVFHRPVSEIPDPRDYDDTSSGVDEGDHQRPGTEKDESGGTREVHERLIDPERDGDIIAQLPAAVRKTFGLPDSHQSGPPRDEPADEDNSRAAQAAAAPDATPGPVRRPEDDVPVEGRGQAPGNEPAETTGSDTQGRNADADTADATAVIPTDGSVPVNQVPEPLPAGHGRNGDELAEPEPLAAAIPGVPPAEADAPGTGQVFDEAAHDQVLFEAEQSMKSAEGIKNEIEDTLADTRSLLDEVAEADAAFPDLGPDEAGNPDDTADIPQPPGEDDSPQAAADPLDTEDPNKGPSDPDGEATDDQQERRRFGWSLGWRKRIREDDKEGIGGAPKEKDERPDSDLTPDELRAKYSINPDYEVLGMAKDGSGRILVNFGWTPPISEKQMRNDARREAVVLFGAKLPDFVQKYRNPLTLEEARRLEQRAEGYQDYRETRGGLMNPNTTSRIGTAGVVGGTALMVANEIVPTGAIMIDGLIAAAGLTGLVVVAHPDMLHDFFREKSSKIKAAIQTSEVAVSGILGALKAGLAQGLHMIPDSRTMLLAGAASYVASIGQFAATKFIEHRGRKLEGKVKHHKRVLAKHQDQVVGDRTNSKGTLVDQHKNQERIHANRERTLTELIKKVEKNEEGDPRIYDVDSAIEITQQLDRIYSEMREAGHEARRLERMINRRQPRRRVRTTLPRVMVNADNAENARQRRARQRARRQAEARRRVENARAYSQPVAEQDLIDSM